MWTREVERRSYAPLTTGRVGSTQPLLSPMMDWTLSSRLGGKSQPTIASQAAVEETKERQRSYLCMYVNMYQRAMEHASACFLAAAYRGHLASGECLFVLLPFGRIRPSCFHSRFVTCGDMFGTFSRFKEVWRCVALAHNRIPR